MAFDDFVSVADFADATVEMMRQAGFAASADDLRAIRPPEVRDDYEDALTMLETARPACGDLEECYRVTIGRVRLGLGEWWEEIEALAKALMEKKRLSGTEAVAVIESRSRIGEQREDELSGGGPQGRPDGSL